MLLNAILIVVLSISGVFLAGISAFVDGAFHRRHKVRDDRAAKVTPEDHRKSQVLNSIASTGLVFAVTNLAHGALFVDEVRPAWRMAAEIAGILLMYDLGYYLLHRFAFHTWSVGSRIHAVHHRIRTPYARDSLYIHPAETIAGVGLLLLCTWAVGPISVWSFGGVFLIYSLLNIFIHSAFHLPFFPFRWLSALPAHHDAHHTSMKGGYYASITPIWDLVFRTARR
jgi:sterol desaturase/sphingolipid hydroxylase (fatty acid hydroxylase superfamily)